MKPKGSKGWLVLAAAGLLLLPACASKKYVQDEVGGQATKIQSVENAVEENQRRIKEVDGRLGETDRRAKDAKMAGEKALTTGNQVLSAAERAEKLARGTLILETTLTNDVTQFGLDTWELPEGAVPELDKLADELSGLSSPELSPDDEVCFVDEWALGRPRLLEPEQSPSNFLGVVEATGLRQVQQHHGCHRILMDAVDRMSLYHPARAHIVVPPPFTLWSLQATNHLGALVGRGQGAIVAPGPVESRERLDRIHLVGKACDVRSEGTALAVDVMREDPRASRKGFQQAGANPASGVGGQLPCSTQRRQRPGDFHCRNARLLCGPLSHAVQQPLGLGMP